MVDLDDTAMRDRVAAARAARLATVGPGGQPHVVPVTFALDEPLLWIAIDQKPKRSRNLARLRNIAAQPKVSVLVDHYEDDWTRLWWVRLDGDARILPEEGWRHPITALQAKYPQYHASPPEGPVIEIHIRTWRGWAASPMA
jgi:PPOX class probable F420-dependent enzyme